jgi:hypothetical protein
MGHRKNIKVSRVVNNRGRSEIKIKSAFINNKKRAAIEKKNNLIRVVKKNTRSVVDRKISVSRQKSSPGSKLINSIKNVGTGRILVMIACGPTVKEVDFSFVDHPFIDVMVINKPYPPVWPPKYWAFCDDSQRQRNEKEFSSYKGTIINSNGVRSHRAGQIVIRMKHNGAFSYDLNDGYVIGRSSVYANMQVAQWMNYDKIFIFGVDMTEVNGQLHHYGVNPDVRPDIRKDRFKNEARLYDKMADFLPESIRKKFYFCSSYNPFGFVKKFNKLNHKDAVEFINNVLVSEKYGKIT